MKNIFDVIVAFVASALSGTGVGGGGILIIYLSMIKKSAQAAAQGINLLCFEASALGALPVHSARRNVRWKIAVFIGIFGLFGAVLGAGLVSVVEPELLKKIFGIFLIISGVLSFLGKKK